MNSPPPPHDIQLSLYNIQFRIVYIRKFAAAAAAAAAVDCRRFVFW